MKIESTFIDKNFEKFVIEKNSKNDNEIFSLDYEGKKYWVKKARETKSNIFHRIFYKLTSFDVLLPVENKNDLESLFFETDKLIEFNNLGINTPKVIGRNTDLFVLEDCGKTVYHYMKNDRYVDLDKEKLLDDVIDCLAKIHNSGSYHGGAQIRNFTCYNDIVFAIDFEDSFNSSIDLETLQFRDFLLFLLSLLKFTGKYNIDFENVIFNYISKTNNKKFIKRLKNTVLKISFLIPLGNLLKSILSKDANGFIEFLKIIKNLKEK